MTKNKTYRIWTYNAKTNKIRVHYEIRTYQNDGSYTQKKVHPKGKDAKQFNEEMFLESYGKYENYILTVDKFIELAIPIYNKTLQVRDKMENHQKIRKMTDFEKTAFYAKKLICKYVP